MGDMIEKMESANAETIGCTTEAGGKRHLSRNMLAKKQMAEQLMAMGLSQESVTRILHLRL